MATLRRRLRALSCLALLCSALATSHAADPPLRRMPSAVTLPEGLTPAEVEAIRTYQFGSTVNFYLRYLETGEFNNEVWSAEEVARTGPEWEAQIRALDSALAKTRGINSPLNVYHVRGASPIPPTPIGGVYRDAGYLSTDPNRAWVKDFLRYRMGQTPDGSFVYMKIRVPQGTPLLDVQGIALNENLNNQASTETLAARGRSLRILRSHTIGKVTVQLAELVMEPQAAAPSTAEAPQVEPLRPIPRSRVGRVFLGRIPYTPSIGGLLFGTVLALKASKSPMDAAIFAGVGAAWMVGTHLTLRGVAALGFRAGARRLAFAIPIVGEVLMAAEVALFVVNYWGGTEAGWGDVWDAYTGKLDRPTSVAGLPPAADRGAYVD